MATAVALNATSSIFNSTGLGTSPALLANIATYRAKPALASFANCYVSSGISPSQTANIIAELNTIGTTITSGHFLLDLYPGNITAVSSATITAWTANLAVPTGSFISHLGKIYTTTGNVFSSSFNGNVINNCTLTGVSGIVKKQAQLPFASGYSGFANIYQRSQGYLQQTFDTVSSIAMLTAKTYSQTGVGFAGPVDLVTNGIGNNTRLVANVVANWGTMYDINNITQIGDTYVFGQNILNQNLGYLNALSDQLTAVGLDITNLPDVPAVKTTTVQEEVMTTISSFVGEIEFPTLKETVITEAVTGNSPTVVTNIYKTVTGGNLAAVVTATGITTSTGSSSQLLTLADYLDLKKVVAPDLYTALNTIGIYTFAEFGQYIGKKLGQAGFRSWTEMSRFLLSLETPTLTNLPSGANTNILYNNTITTLTNTFGTGSGPLGNPVMVDYLGACAGDPYTNRFYAINSNYDALVTQAGITTALTNLDLAIINYSNDYNTYLASEIPDSAIPPAPPVGDGVPPIEALRPPFSVITSNVAAVNSALSSLPATGTLAETVAVCNSGWYLMLSRIPIEVANLNRADVAFTSGTTLGLLSFAENIGQLASDKTQAEGYQFFANITTNDAAGDSIKAVVAETLNTRALNGVGVNIYNDPNPRLKIFQSQAQNTPLTTYLSQNK
jgi:hypothetical protein